MAKAAGLEVVAAGWGHSVEPIQDSDDTCDGCVERSWARGLWFICVILYFHYMISLHDSMKLDWISPCG